MDGYANQFPHQLSGGQQKLPLRDLSPVPLGSLLADEPTGNLDTATGGLVLDLLRRRDGKIELGVAVVMAAHSDVSFVDRIVKLRDGANRRP